MLGLWLTSNFFQSGHQNYVFQRLDSEQNFPFTSHYRKAQTKIIRTESLAGSSERTHGIN